MMGFVLHDGPSIVDVTFRHRVPPAGELLEMKEAAAQSGLEVTIQEEMHGEQCLVCWVERMAKSLKQDREVQKGENDDVER